MIQDSPRGVKQVCRYIVHW